MDWLDFKEFIKDAIKIIFFIVLVLFVLQYIFSVTKVVGNSMYPTLQDEEVLLLNKFAYRFRDIKRGEIVSLKYADTKYLIKRIIGIPGDQLYIKDSVLYINGKEVEEKYLPSDLKYKDFSLDDLGFDKIPEDKYLVLGDNRVNSLDSREIGLISKEDIIGKVSIRFWPLNKFKFIK